MGKLNREPGNRRASRRALAFLAVLSLAAGVLSSCVQPFQTEQLSILTDENAPMIELAGGLDNTLFNGSVLVSGVSRDLDGGGAVRSLADPALVPVLHWEVPAFGDSGELSPNADGSFEFVLDTSGYDRDVSLLLTASDTNGNISARTVSLRYDPRGPAITVLTPESNSIIDRMVQVSGTVHDIDSSESTESVAGVSWSVIGTALGGDIVFDSDTGEFAFAIDTEGINTDIGVRIEATDVQGDVTIHVLSLVQDDLGPDISILSPENYSEYSASVTVTGTITNRPGATATDEVRSASYTTLNGVETGTLTLEEGGNFSFTIPISS